MREFEFRGKRIDNGEWIYGYYVGFGSLIVFNTIDGFTQNDYGSRCTSTRVNPESVGQFTGLIDKNGKKIFEGDVFGNENMPNRYVIFEDGKYCFNKVHSQGADVLSQDRVGRLEIIGNIHDNPELLK